MNPRVFLFLGEEEFLKEEAIDKLRQFCGLNKGGGGSSSCHIFGTKDEDFSIEKVIALAQTPSLFSPCQIIVVRDIEKLDFVQRKILFSYLKQPAEHTYLVLMSRTKIRQKENPELEFLSSLAKQPNVEKREFIPLSEGEVRKRIVYWAKERGKLISSCEIDFILTKVGRDPAHLQQTIEKVCLYAKDKQRLELADLEQAIGKEVSLDVYKMIEAILNKNVARAVMILRGLNQFNIKPEKIIGALTWELRRLSIAKRLLREGFNQYQIKTKLNIFYADKFFSNLKGISLEELEARLRKLLYIDTRIKTGKIKPFFALESWILEASI